MYTHSKEKKELEKEIRALEKKELHIGMGYKFYRKHGKKNCVKVVGYDEEFVQIDDGDTQNHFVPRELFNSDNFSKDR